MKMNYYVLYIYAHRFTYRTCIIFMLLKPRSLTNRNRWIQNILKINFLT